MGVWVKSGAHSTA